MKNCNRCGRFRNKKNHVCLPVKVKINNQIAYSFTTGKEKSVPSLKKHMRVIKKTPKQSQLAKGLMIGLSSLVLTVWSLTALANYDTSISYTATTTPVVAEILSKTTEITSQVIEEKTEVEPESLHDKITRYALKYDIPRESMRVLVGCETAWTFSPTLQSHARYRDGTREKSFGLAQIHAPAHPHVSYEQMIDPDFALNFIGKNWSKRHLMWVTCTEKYNI